MGVLNITPDSFFEASRTPPGSPHLAVKAQKMIEEGAAILDIGGLSSRPGAVEISEKEEIKRVVPAIEHLSAAFPEIPLSVDTFRAEVAKEAIKAGATIINDISGGQFDPDIHRVVANNPVSYVLMHVRGGFNSMHSMTEYQDLISDLLKYFVKKLRQLHRLGIRDILIDPGFGFSKTMEDNYRIMDQLGVIRLLAHPLLVGVSRKSTLSKTIGMKAEDTLFATTALHMHALINGANILRVHDVRAASDAIAVFNKLREAKNH
jgi:dihydropteroate synthase